jgi:hypothetical protein
VFSNQPDPSRLASLVSWLHHDHAKRLTSLDLEAKVSCKQIRPQLSLPLQQLQQLRSLRLINFTLLSQQSCNSACAGSTAAAIDSSSEWSSSNRLLPRSSGSYSSSNSNPSAPGFLPCSLTFLQLDDLGLCSVSNDPVLPHQQWRCLSNITGLQRLRLESSANFWCDVPEEEGGYTAPAHHGTDSIALAGEAAALQHLSQLTHLHLDLPFSRFAGDVHAALPAALRTLKALQHLGVHGIPSAEEAELVFGHMPSGVTCLDLSNHCAASLLISMREVITYAQVPVNMLSN